MDIEDSDAKIDTNYADVDQGEASVPIIKKKAAAMKKPRRWGHVPHTLWYLII